METATPMLKQYLEIKAQNPESILFFRLGDFYEMFGDDARKASRILDLVLTSRDAGKSGKMPMCGIPYHAAESYIARLIKAGLKVAICEQVEDPALAKGLVKRQVIRVVTSGTYIDESNFESRAIIALYFDGNRAALAFTDTASGVIRTSEYPALQELAEGIAKLQAYECVFPQAQEPAVRQLFNIPILRSKAVALSPFEDWCFNTEIARKSLLEHFGVHNLKGFGIEELPLCVAASGALLEYLKRMHKQPMRHVHAIALHTDEEYVFISPAAYHGLDLENLMHTIDHTLTSMGKRCLKEWVYRPLRSKKALLLRQAAVTLLKENPRHIDSLHELLRNTPDMEKCVSRISCGSGAARDLLALRNTLLKQPLLKEAIASLPSANPLLEVGDVPAIRSLLEKAVNPSIPLSHPEGQVVNKGYDPELDELRDIQENGRQWLKGMQEREAARTGISSLKVGYNQVFGYYIEISRANLDRVPQDFIRKQTLANAERYITQELKEFEEKILTAESKVMAIERRIIEALFKEILDHAAQLLSFSASLARVDALRSLSCLASSPGYVLPLITEDTVIDIREGRHPIVEKALQDPFIPNDTAMDGAENHLLILTGPNMAGKSTYIRQVGVLVVMAQMGSYIPASSASIGLVDKVFTRIGSHDEITKGQSTFMVEMSETAGILNNMSPKSLVILDEIGRGTSTFDGLSLAWAISEHLAKAKVRTLFATHFHELTALAEEHPGAKNYNVSVKEWNDQVIFLHKIIPGGTDDSYGIYVAKLAGIPREVVKRAEQILSRLEFDNNLQERIMKRLPSQEQLSLFTPQGNAEWQKLAEEIEGIDLDGMTPLDALNKLQELKKKAEGCHGNN